MVTTIAITRVIVGDEPNYVQFDRGDGFVEIRMKTDAIFLTQYAFVEAVVALGLAGHVQESERRRKTSLRSGLGSDAP